jgi:hypothetical protein
MESISVDPALAMVGTDVVAITTQGLAASAAVSPSLTAVVPAGADAVSLQASEAFVSEGAAMLAAHAAAQQELARLGAALMDIARVYTQVDGTSAGVLAAGGITLPDVAETAVAAGAMVAADAVAMPTADVAMAMAQSLGMGLTSGVSTVTQLAGGLAGAAGHGGATPPGLAAAPPSTAAGSSPYAPTESPATTAPQTSPAAGVTGPRSTGAGAVPEGAINPSGNGDELSRSAEDDTP